MTDERGKITQFTYDGRGNLIQTAYPDGGIEYRKYDLGGRLTSVISPQNYSLRGVNGAYTSYEYDGMDRKTITKRVYRKPGASSDTTATVEALTYDKVGMVLSRTDALGNITTYGYGYDYGSCSKMSWTVDASGVKTVFIYDAFGRVVSETDKNNVKSEYTYDSSDNILTKKTAGILVLINTYDKLGNVLTSTDANGKTTVNTYNLMGWLSSTTLPGDTSISANTITYCYDKIGNVINKRDSMSREWISTYDNVGRTLTSTEQKAGGSEAVTTSTKYDVAGNPIYAKDGNGNQTTCSYDNLNRVQTVRNAKNQETKYTYDLNGNKLSETNWRGNKFEFIYDELNRLIERRDPFGKLIEKLEYDDNDRQVKSTDALSQSQIFAYDALGRLLSTTDAMGYATSQTYDGAGNVTSRADGNGNVTNFQYDSFNRLKKVTNPDKTTIEYTYDNNGNTLTQKDGIGNVTLSEYNSRNLPSKCTDQAGQSESFAYNPDGSLSRKTDRNGVVTQYAYDIHGRVLSENAGGEIVSFTYDGNGNQLTMTDSTGNTVRVYDALNRVTQKAVPVLGTTYFEYDIADGSNGAIAEKATYPGGSVVTKVYDKAGKLWQVRDGGDTTTHEYFDNGNLKKLSYPGTLTEEYTYYKNNKLETLTNKRGTVILDAYKYSYDKAGNLSYKEDGLGRTSYEYTALNQLKTVREPAGKVTSYKYDAAGNRAAEVIMESGKWNITTDCTYSLHNRLIKTVRTQGGSALTTTFGYDKNGNMLSRIPEIMEGQDHSIADELKVSVGDEALKAGVYVYDKRNRMVEATVGGETVVSAYNGEGLRVSKISGGTTWNYLYEYDKIVLELEGEVFSTAKLTKSVYGMNLISRDASGAKVYYIYNGHHDVVLLMTGAGVEIARYYYDAFGQILTDTDTAKANPYRYSGYFWDNEVGLYYLKSRFYDPGLARFMTEDTYRGETGDPLSLNLYTYCANNPLVYWDPTGHVKAGDDKLSADTQTYIKHLTDLYNSTSDPNYKKQIEAEADKARAADKANNSGGGSTTVDVYQDTPDPGGSSPIKKGGSGGGSSPSGGSSGGSSNGTGYVGTIISGPSGTFEVNRNDWTSEQFGAIVAYVGMGYKPTNDVNSSTTSGVIPVLFPIIINPGFQYNPKIDSKDYIYDRHAAVEYAMKWADGQNPDYPYYKDGGDCTNFISQALVAGGLPTDRTWTTYWVPFLGTKVTRAWSYAPASYEYFKSPANDFVKSVNTIETKSDIFLLLITGQVKQGDLMYFESSSTGKIVHASIITQIVNGDIIYCQHSGVTNLNYKLGEQRFGVNEEIGYKIHVVSIKDEGSAFNGIYL